MACNTQTLFPHLLSEGSFNRSADGLGPGLRAVSLGNHLHWNLARTETRHLHCARHPLEARFHLLFDVSHQHRHVNTTFQRAPSFLGVLHEISLIGVRSGTASDAKATT